MPPSLSGSIYGLMTPDAVCRVDMDKGWESKQLIECAGDQTAHANSRDV